ncbi:MAG: hemerythrin domain-containing protein [Nocardioidaceae bacterium]
MSAPPTPPMTMNRLIHDAVRRDLTRLELALEPLERRGDRPRALDLQRAYANLRDELTRHHEGEDRWIWPMLAGAGGDHELLTAMESEHHAMAEALAETAVAMERVAGSGLTTDATAARVSVVRTGSLVEQHFVHEERDLEPALVPFVESPEWKAVEKKLSRQPPRVAGRFFAWLTDGMTEEGRTFLRATVPTPVVTVLARVFGRSYRRQIAPVWRAS